MFGVLLRGKFTRATSLHGSATGGRLRHFFFDFGIESPRPPLRRHCLLFIEKALGALMKCAHRGLFRQKQPPPTTFRPSYNSRLSTLIPPYEMLSTLYNSFGGWSSAILERLYLIYNFIKLDGARTFNQN